MNPPFCFIDYFCSTHFLLQVSFLFIGQPCSMTLKPAVELLLVRFQFNHAPFIQQRHHDLIFHCRAHRICMDKASKLPSSIFVFFRQRCPCKSNITAAGKDPAHFAVDFSVLPPVAFIHQHKDVWIVVGSFFVRDSLKFINHGGNNIGFFRSHQLKKMFA